MPNEPISESDDSGLYESKLVCGPQSLSRILLIVSCAIRLKQISPLIKRGNWRFYPLPYLKWRVSSSQTNSATGTFSQPPFSIFWAVSTWLVCLTVPLIPCWKAHNHSSTSSRRPHPTSSTWTAASPHWNIKMEFFPVTLPNILSSGR